MYLRKLCKGPNYEAAWQYSCAKGHVYAGKDNTGKKISQSSRAKQLAAVCEGMFLFIVLVSVENGDIRP